MYSTRKSKLLGLSFVTALISAWPWTPVMAQSSDDYDYDSADTTTTSTDSSNEAAAYPEGSTDTTDTTGATDTTGTTDTTTDVQGNEDGTGEGSEDDGSEDDGSEYYDSEDSGNDGSYGSDGSDGNNGYNGSEGSSDGSGTGISGDGYASPTETEQLGDDGIPVASATVDDGSLTPTATDSIDETYSTPTIDPALAPATTDPLLTPTTTDALPTTTEIIDNPTTSVDSLISVTPTATPTASPTIAESSSGLSNTNKAIIGGVVGGVGGLVLLGAIVFFALRRSKRSRRQSDLEVFQPRNDNYEVPFASGEKHEWDGSQSSPSMAQQHQPYGMSAVSLHPQQY
ncbi:hypothetical protein CLU79DRAFT_749599 [Phycomyces nitens]|nr:hypothetical protein CLU79DRAFT_749599 [Phycomyces nitens]